MTSHTDPSAAKLLASLLIEDNSVTRPVPHDRTQATPWALAISPSVASTDRSLVSSVTELNGRRVGGGKATQMGRVRGMFQRFVHFITGLFHKPSSGPGTIADGPEMELEKERRRGVRGD